MLDTVFSFFQRWANLGVNKDQPSHQQNLTMFVNIMAMPKFLTAFITTFLITHPSNLGFLAIVVGCTSIAGQTFVWILNGNNKSKMAKHVFIIVQQMTLFVNTLIFPQTFGFDSYWFIMILFSHLLFSSKEMKSKIFFSSTALVCSVLSMMGLIHVPGLAMQLDPSIAQKFAGFHAFNSAFYFLLTTAGFSTLNYLYEKKLQENELQILQSNKLASLGEISGGIAHEINNPLSIIIGRTELLKSKVEQSTVTNEYLIANLTNILQTGRRIAKVIYGLRKFARASSEEPKSDHLLIDVVNDTLILTQEKLKSQGIEVETRGIENTSVYCNSLQLSQVLYNLISNSAEHMKSLSEKWIRIETKHSKHHVEILVIDSGLGIPKKVAARIMDPFFTTKEVGAGTGMGLSISHGIIHQEGGELYYDPHYPNTTFVIRLPKKDAASQPLKSVA